MDIKLLLLVLGAILSGLGFLLFARLEKSLEGSKERKKINKEINKKILLILKSKFKFNRINRR